MGSSCHKHFTKMNCCGLGLQHIISGTIYQISATQSSLAPDSKTTQLFPSKSTRHTFTSNHLSVFCHVTTGNVHLEEPALRAILILFCSFEDFVFQFFMFFSPKCPLKSGPAAVSDSAFSFKDWLYWTDSFRKMQITAYGNLMQKLKSVNWGFQKFFHSFALLSSRIFQAVFRSCPR